MMNILLSSETVLALSKPYRMVLESLESDQEKQILPLFTRVYFFRVCKTHAAKQLPQGYTTGQQNSYSFCWSLLKCARDRACRKQGM